MTTFAVSVDQAVMNAVVAWLTPAFSDAVVSSRWPDAARSLPPLAITVIPAGDRQDDLLEPTVTDTSIVHTTVTPRITAPTAVDLGTANAVLNACKASYEAHRLDVAAHAAADTIHSLSAVPNATDLASGVALATAFLGVAGVFNLHATNGAAHTTAELVAGGQAFAQSASQLAPPVTVGDLVAAAEAIRTALHKHYSARIYTALLHACTLPLQLDVWATYDAVRDDAMARLDVRLNGDGLGVAGGGPVSGLLLPLGDGISGYVDTWWDGPSRNDTPDAVQSSEFRSTYKGTASFNLTVRLQGSRMTTVVFKLTGSERTPPPTTLAPDVITVATAVNADGYTVTVS